MIRTGCWRRWRWLLVAGLVMVICCCGFSTWLLADLIRFRRLPVESVAYTLTHNGIARSYRLYVPSELDPAEPVPLVFVLHGGSGDAESAEQITRSGFHALADQHGFIVVYPEGLDRHWIDGRAANATDRRDEDDDVTFIAALIDHLADTYPVDRSRVYATGISNGAMMSLRLACDLADQITAVAIVTGSMWDDLAAACAPPRPVPILILNGTDDPLVRWDGGDIILFGRSRGRVWPTEDTVNFWRDYDACPAEPQIETLPDTDPGDHTHVTRTTYAPCAENTAVELYTIAGGGHTWPGGAQYLHHWLIGRTSRDIDANAVIWSFFASH
jgi:polyhydroxybutyrate depolymerase